VDPTLMIIATLIPFLFAGGVLGVTGAMKAGRRGRAKRLQSKLVDRGWASKRAQLPPGEGDAGPRGGVDGDSARAPNGTPATPAVAEPVTNLRVTGDDDVTDFIGLSGLWRGYEVRVQVDHVATNEGTQQIYFASMKLPVDWAGGAWIQPERRPDRVDAEVTLPQDAFPTATEAFGDRAAVIALLNERVRACLTDCETSIEGGHARTSMRFVVFSLDRIEAAFEQLTRLCDAVPRLDCVASLEQIVLHDPWPSMRGAAFDALTSGRSRARDAFVDEALESPFVDVRARAAAFRGRAALDVAREVLRDRAAAPAPRAHVARLVATHDASPDVAEAIAAGLEHDDASRAMQWADAARVVLERTQGDLAMGGRAAERASAARDRVLRALHARIESDADVALAHYALAAEVGDDDWYPALAKAFDHAFDEFVVAALSAIAETAGLGRVEHLKSYAGESTGLGASVRVNRPWSRKLKREADRTIARIQERRGGAAGGLALADHAEGALATVDE